MKGTLITIGIIALVIAALLWLVANMVKFALIVTAIAVVVFVIVPFVKRKSAKSTGRPCPAKSSIN